MAVYNKSVAKDETFNGTGIVGTPEIIDPAAVTITTADSANYFGPVTPSTNYLESNTLLGAINVNAGRDSVILVDMLASAGAAGAVNVTGASNSSAYVTVSATGSIGATTATSNGYNSSVDVYLNATLADKAVGSIGAISAKANGANSYSDIYATALMASIGAVNVMAKADASAYVGAYASGDINTLGAVQGGSVGAVTLNATGYSADVYADVYADGGFSAGDAVFKAGGNVVPLRLRRTVTALPQELVLTHTVAAASAL